MKSLSVFQNFSISKTNRALEKAHSIKKISILFILTMISFAGCKKNSEPSPISSEIQETSSEIQENATVPLQQEYDDEQDFTITIIEHYLGNSAAINGYTGNKKEVRIPPRIQDLPVDYIEDRAFYEKQLIMVSIPDEVIKIGDSAFAHNKLSNIYIPYSVREIGDSAFAYNEMTDITIPRSVYKIGDNAFAYNQFSNILYLPDSIREIGEYAFSNNELTGISIPYGVEKIGNGAFKKNKLTGVTVPETVNLIGYSAFDENPITTIIITSRIVTDMSFPNNFYDFIKPEPYIKAGVYTWNGSFWSAKYYEYDDPKEFKFSINGDGSASIDGYTDSVPVNDPLYSSKIIRIPSQWRGLPVTVVKGFQYKGITSVTIPNSVTHIGKYAFLFNPLTSITIPDSVIEIGEEAFCSNRLTSVSLGNNIRSIGGLAFYENQLTDITIPDSVKFIYGYAFSKNQIKRITIPENVSTIHDVTTLTGFKETRKAFDEHYEVEQFDRFYETNEKRAGTYILKDKTWSVIQY